MQVWKLLLDLETNTHSWTSDAVNTLDMAVIAAEVENAQTTSFKMGKADQGDAVVQRIKDELVEFQEVLTLTLGLTLALTLTPTAAQRQLPRVGANPKVRVSFRLLLGLHA